MYHSELAFYRPREDHMQNANFERRGLLRGSDCAGRRRAGEHCGPRRRPHGGPELGALSEQAEGWPAA